jgi:hypothetical protein
MTEMIEGKFKQVYEIDGMDLDSFILKTVGE